MKPGDMNSLILLDTLYSDQYTIYMIMSLLQQL